MKHNYKQIHSMSRREFLKKGAYITAGALGYSYGLRKPISFAYTPGVTGNRVVWIHDVNATFWDGITGYYGDYVDQQRVNAMIDRGIKELTGSSNTVSAWQQIIPNYSPGKKIGIKVNINNCGSIDYCPNTNIDALPQPVNGIIAGLKSMGVSESDIYLMEPSRVFPVRIGDPIYALYPSVQLWEQNRGDGRTYAHLVSYNSNDPSLVIYHSHPSISDSRLPDQFLDIAYFINMPIIKGHGESAGITFTFKNNFGLFASITKFHPYTFYLNPDYSYDKNPLHDIYLNPHIKDKTVLIVADALFGHRTTNAGPPQFWNTFGGKFPNSFFMSTDPVAVDSVMYDFINAESGKPAASQLYLHRAVELGLGTHEHWNNSTEKEYSVIDFKKIDMDKVTRLDIDRKVKDFKGGSATQQDVKDKINEYMETE